MADPKALITDILDTHHARLRKEMPEIDLLVDAADNIALRSVWRSLHRFMNDHMQKEEMILFPNIIALADGQDVSGLPLEGPITVMGMEHQQIEEWVGELTELAPALGSGAPKLLGLLEDIKVHAAKEDGQLFPAALALMG